MRLKLLLSTIALLALACTNISTDTVTPGGVIVDVSEFEDSATRVFITATPKNDPELESVWVIIPSLAVHTSASATIDDAGWQEILLAPPVELDLQQFGGGINIDLSDQVFAPGTYHQMRLTIDSASLDLVSSDSVVADLTAQAVAFPLGTGVTIVAGSKFGVLVNFDVDASLQLLGDTWTMTPTVNFVEAFKINSDGRTSAVFIEKAGSRHRRL